ncbi:CopD family protein [Marinobacterium rhizophilum]|uniref:CopD family protein n=1 Tax=Marinobacterium rhizophilum TaxID=420402 RepID=A0ABY5HIW8_9GAMM|nr:CopD family protein [Marinobacterium rhizophilum]UTW11894.1 CopD family protein [Marinobacterium rhizophilum]
MPLALSLHLLAAVIWVGGMFFAYQCLRPVAARVLEPPQRLTLWCHLFSRFFVWVWVAVVTLVVSGHGMIALMGGMARVGLHIHVMLVTGYLMVALFLHLYFAPYQRLKKAVGASDWPLAATQLNQIRRFVGINLLLGLITVVNAVAGPMLYA